KPYFSVEDRSELQPHLYGISHYGDNIEDEWFIVYLLFQITKEINGIVARVVDADGEFLLIEAANYLPKWANPDTCENRVYIYQGNLHIIPPVKSGSGVSVSEALSQLSRSPQTSYASTNIQNSILNRIKGYPNRIVENLHSTTLYVPLGVAAILKHKPGLVAPAVQAFCNRDLVDSKACRAMKYFPPENRVYCRTTFTKCLYAMLNHSKYVPDKRTGWNLPVLNSPQHKSHTLGVKLACGFEILVSQAKPSADVENDKGWHAYLKTLKEKGFFRDLLEHSRDYNDLLNKAKEYYINYRDSMQSTPVIGQEILDLTKNLDYNADEFRKDTAQPEDDDDSWLDIAPKDLDELLQANYGRKDFTQLNGNADATNFTEKLTTFLDHMSDVQGVEFPEESPPSRPPRGLKRGSKTKVSFSSDTKLDEKPNSNKVSFDPAAFTCALQNILDFMIPDDDNWDLDSDSDMSAYGEDREVNFEGDDDGKNKMKEYMAQMDLELQKTTIGESFHKVEKTEGFDDVESFRPVDIDMNALKNVLESYQSQMGEAGPASTMLGPMGIHLEPGTSRDGLKKPAV
ncbi:protein ecdysoneless, partial [Photinus pyralis]|uniref:protein ecdysoneless n=1 Tax=Photinus pyralis TaxID=7054 RepID=UPI0012672EA5